MEVPFADLDQQYRNLRTEISNVVQQVFDSSAFAGGPFVRKFEIEFAQFCGCKDAVCVSSGTAGLWLTLEALGIGPGDEVITVPNTHIATAEAISMTGARPIFVDIDEDSYNLNPNLLEAAISKRTRAVIPVHMFGQTADMDSILEITRRRGLEVIENAAQAHGASYKNRPAGSMGKAGCYSFYPSKNLGGCGEGGAVVTSDACLAEKLRILRDHGQDQRHRHRCIGWNARMDAIQGAILGVKLRLLPEWNAARRENAQRYRDFLGNTESVLIPLESPHGNHAYHLYAIRVRNRDRVFKELQRRGVQCRIHYPLPIHLQPAYDFLRLGRGTFPVAERVQEEILSLPMFPELTYEQIQFVCNELQHALVHVEEEVAGELTHCQ